MDQMVGYTLININFDGSTTYMYKQGDHIILQLEICHSVIIHTKVVLLDVKCNSRVILNQKDLSF